MERRHWLTPRAAFVRMCAIIFGCLLCCNAECADKVVPAQLTLATALSTALGTNATLKEAESNYLAALSNSKIADIGTSVEFGSTASLDRSPGVSDLSNLIFGNYSYKTLSGTETTLGLSPFATGTKQGSVGLTLRKPLMKGRGILSDRYDRVQSAKSNVRVQDKEFYLSRQNAAIKVTNAYYRAVLAREQLKVQEKAVEIAMSVADSAKKRADAGYAAGIEATRAEIRVAQTKNELNVQQQSAKGALEGLMLAIGAGVGEVPELVDNVPETSLAVPSLDESLKRALANRAELTIADEQIENQKRLLAVAKDQLRPSLDWVAGFNSSSQDNGLISSSIIDLGAFNAGFEYRVPLDRRANREQQQIEERQLEVLQRLREYRLESIAEEVGRAYRAVESQKTSLEIFSKNLDVAKQNLQFANRMMEDANGTNRDVLDAQEALTQTEASILSARTELYLAVLNLRNAMGEDLITTGEQ